jgi:hypothetical protein
LEVIFLKELKDLHFFWKQRNKFVSKAYKNCYDYLNNKYGAMNNENVYIVSISQWTDNVTLHFLKKRRFNFVDCRNSCVEKYIFQNREIVVVKDVTFVKICKVMINDFK